VVDWFERTTREIRLYRWRHGLEGIRVWFERCWDRHAWVLPDGMEHKLARPSEPVDASASDDEIVPIDGHIGCQREVPKRRLTQAVRRCGVRAIEHRPD
jgi:hypothetical protein